MALDELLTVAPLSLDPSCRRFRRARGRRRAVGVRLPDHHAGDAGPGGDRDRARLRAGGHRPVVLRVPRPRQGAVLPGHDAGGAQGGPAAGPGAAGRHRGVGGQAAERRAPQGLPVAHQGRHGERGRAGVKLRRAGVDRRESGQACRARRGDDTDGWWHAEERQRHGAP